MEKEITQDTTNLVKEEEEDQEQVDRITQRSGPG